MEYDLVVTWRRADGSTVDLPATLCGYPEDNPASRADAMVEAVDSNVADFPDDLDDEAVPIRLTFSDA